MRRSHYHKRPIVIVSFNYRSLSGFLSLPPPLPLKAPPLSLFIFSTCSPPAHPYTPPLRLTFPVLCIAHFPSLLLIPSHYLPPAGDSPAPTVTVQPVVIPATPGSAAAKSSPRDYFTG